MYYIRVHLKDLVLTQESFYEDFHTATQSVRNISDLLSKTGVNADVELRRISQNGTTGNIDNDHIWTKPIYPDNLLSP